MNRSENDKQKQQSSVQIIEGQQCLQLESLWREVFNEDSDKFTEYYYQEKAKGNRGLFLAEDSLYQSMMFLTPYEMQIGRKQESISYIIGVATKEECRHQGMMDRLLRKSFEILFEESAPFTFLMPANPAIYEPYQFRYIYDKAIYSLNHELISEEMMEKIIEGENVSFSMNGKKITASSLQCEQTESVENDEIDKKVELKSLVEFANKWLQKNMQVYTLRTSAYYELQCKESIAQNGAVVVLKDENEICGFFLYAKEGDVEEIQEVMMAEEIEDCSLFIKEKQNKPIIMARIISVEAMLRYLTSEIPQMIDFMISDSIIIKNNGVFRCKVDCNGCEVTKLQGSGELQAAEHNVSHYEFSIEELIQVLFGYGEKYDIPGIVPLNKVFINEIV